MAYSTVAERQQAEAVTFQFPNASLKSGEDSPESKNPSQGFHLLACKTRVEPRRDEIRERIQEANGA